MGGMLWFYGAHRLCHESTWIYQNIHKQHHEFKGTIGFAAEYAHPAESLIVNNFTFILGPLLLGCHVHTWFVYSLMGLWSTYTDHLGYDFTGCLLHRIGLLNARSTLHHDRRAHRILQDPGDEAGGHAV